MKHLLKLLDCSTEEIIGLLDLADQLKYEQKHNISHRHLEGKSLGMIFQKSSTRFLRNRHVSARRSGAVPVQP